MGEKVGNSGLMLFASGIGAILVTLYMASGKWDIFDFGISVTILVLGLFFLISNGLIKEIKIIPVSIVFSVVTIAALISFLSVLSIAFSIDWIASVDVATYYDAIGNNSEKEYSSFKLTQKSYNELIYSLYSKGYSEIPDDKLSEKAIEIEEKKGKLRKLEKLIGKQYSDKFEFLKAVEHELNQDFINYKDDILKFSNKKSILIKDQMRWQLSLFIISMLFWLIVFSISKKI